MVKEVLESPVVKPLTDVVKKIMFKDGEDCGCDDRQQKLNDRFKRRLKPVRCLTENNYHYLKDELPKISLHVDYSVMTELTRIHASVFNYQFKGACSSCTSRNRKIVNDLRSILKIYENDSN